MSFVCADVRNCPSSDGGGKAWFWVTGCVLRQQTVERRWLSTNNRPGTLNNNCNDNKNYDTNSVNIPWPNFALGIFPVNFF
ncbi:MAG: hypothetical protein LWX09_00190 [Bacteroidia bacterium]|nr:hypothetical protein [Bacteroidia bacterium]